MTCIANIFIGFYNYGKFVVLVFSINAKADDLNELDCIVKGAVCNVFGRTYIDRNAIFNIIYITVLYKDLT